MKILIVEDEAALRQQLESHLTENGYECRSAEDGEDGLYQATEYPFDMLIVDLGLPLLDGTELIRRARQAGYAGPVLILTARGGWKSRVEGLDAGADDYMEKPFHVEELTARVRALTRRMSGHNSCLSFGPIVLDTERQQVTLEGTQMELTAFEYKILEYMMRHPDQVVSKSTLTDYLYDQDFERDSNVIEVFIGRLRKKLATVPGFAPIRTLRGRGYQFITDQ